MRGGTLFSGICAPETAMPEIDWRWRAEIDPFANAVAEARHPGIPNLGNAEAINPDAVEPVDLLVFGSPCQSFSIAGKRGGLDDPRGNLTLVGFGLAGRIRPRWVVWENVPGVLSDDRGRTFGAVLGLLGQLGYGFAYRVLDAQFFGVPQRRRRVFVVGYLGDWRPAAAVLFEPESLSGNPPPRREAREGIASSSRDGLAATLGAKRDGGWRGDLDNETYVARCDTTGEGSRQDYETCTLVTHALRADGFDASEDGTGRGTPLVPVQYRYQCPSCGHRLVASHKRCPTCLNGRPIAFAQNTCDEVCLFGGDGQTAGALSAEPGMKQQTYVAFSSKDHGADAGDISPTLRAGGHSSSHANAGVPPAVAFDMRGREGGAQFEGPHDTANIRAGSGGSSRSYVAASSVRRLTPRECERLQGFPDDYTLVTYRGKPAADGPRYRALGNSMALPVVRWILTRVLLADRVIREASRAA